MGTINPASILRRAAALLAVLAQSAFAQEATPSDVVVDPPGRVARLSYVEGPVSLAPAESEDWADAVLNRPLTSGDRLWLDRDARAELEVGSTTVHLDHTTGFGFVQLDDAVMQMSLTEGAATLRVRDLAERESIQVETPNATVLLRRPGEYYLETDAGDDRTIVKARSGEAEIRGGVKSYVLRANHEGVFTGLEDLRAQIGPIAPRTAFESWANDRSLNQDRSVSSRYVSREVIGYEDLDDHGQWMYEPSYGYVWQPLYVARGWAPYRFGSWVWISPWGWTWIDDARWGFAPFHYGRWAYLRNHWCWVPGPRHVRPVYAPALVSWVGRPPARYSASVGRDVKWSPLAPHQVYVPSYRHTPRHIRRVNLSNTVIADDSQITRAYTVRDPPRPSALARGPAQVAPPSRQEPTRQSRQEPAQQFRQEPAPPSRQEPAPSYSQTLPRERVAEREPETARAAGSVTRESPRSYSPPASSSRPESSSRPQSSPQGSSPAAEQSDRRGARETPSSQRSQPQSGYGSRPSYQQR